MKKRKGILFTSLFVLGFSLLLVNKNCEEVVRDKSIIIELKDVNGTDVESRNEVEKAFKRELQSVVGLNYRVTSNLKHASNILFLEVNSDDINKIKNLSLVENVKENKRYQINKSLNENYSYNPFDEKTVPDKNYSAVSMNIDSNSLNGKNTLVAVLDDSFVINHEAYNDLDSSVVRYSKNDIDKFKGESDFFAKYAGYKNNKVPFYYSYGTKNLDLTFKDNDTYHGQHVAGIVGGNGNKYKGISPQSQLALMKVTDSKGNFTSEDTSETSDTMLLRALNDCSILDVDAINMSFGLGLIDFGKDDLYRSVFTKLSNEGISINYAAGNDGREQYTYRNIQNLSTSNVETSILGGTLVNDNTMAIASTRNNDDVVVPSMVSTLSGTTIRLRDQIVDHRYSSDGTTTNLQKFDKMMPFYSFVKDGQESAILDYVVVPNYGLESDYKNLDVKGKIALIQRGSAVSDDDPNINQYTFIAKIRNAVKNGASGVIIYNNEGASNQVGYFALNSDTDSLEQKYYVPMGYINSFDGELLKNQEVKKIVVSKDLVSDFTSDGSTANLQLKPEIAAPGDNIYSSVGPSNTSYGYMSGTSMASPNYSGAFVNVLSNFDLSTSAKRKKAREKLTLKIMSTANPISQSNGAYYSPRLLGAGEIDASGSFKSSVYLEGNVKNRTKIELKNNDDIKKGDVKFDVKTFNESPTDKKYSVELYIQAPELTGLDTTSGSKFKGHKFQTSKDILLNKVDVGNVVIPSGKSCISIGASITDANKEYLENNFENGTYLEGYALFKSLDNDEDLTIPYMGFYGNYDKESAVEPFNFEKEDGVIYGSDLLNSELKNSLSKPNADFSSMWVALKKDLSTANYTNISSNKASFKTYGSEVIYDSENNEVILGQNGSARKFVIQQFVNRSVTSSKVEMISKTDGTSVLAPIDDKDHVDHMFSFNFTDENDKAGKLYKTMMLTNLFSGDIYADRAYSYFDFDNKEQFPNGVANGLYDFIFTYTLVNGSVQTLKYTVNVTDQKYSSNIAINKQNVSTIDGEKYIVYRFSGNGIKKFKVNNSLYNIDKDENGYFAKVKLSDLGSSSSVYAVLVDKYGFSETALMSLGKGGYSIISKGLSETDKISVSIAESFALRGGYIYTFDVKNSSNKSITLGDEIIVGFDPLDGASPEGMKVYTMDKRGKTSETQFEIVEGKVIVKATSTGKIVVVYNSINENTNNSLSAKTLVIIIICTILVGIVITLGLLMLVNKKLRKK